MSSNGAENLYKESTQSRPWERIQREPGLWVHEPKAYLWIQTDPRPRKRLDTGIAGFPVF